MDYSGQLLTLICHAASSGGAAAIAAIDPPSRKPDDADEDDDSCKSDKDECPDCGGSDGYGLCSSGDQKGCPCEEKQNCPNEPPRCSDSDCGGDVSSPDVEKVQYRDKTLILLLLEWRITMLSIRRDQWLHLLSRHCTPLLR